MSLAGRIDEDRLARAVRLTLDAEPILGCRFVERWFRPYWQRLDNLDRMEFCEIRESSNGQADMLHFFESLPAVPLRVLLLRGDTASLCIKLDHRAGDAGAMREYAYLLADVYNRLGGDPHYCPVPNVGGRRGTRDLGDGFSLRERIRILRRAVQAAGRFKRVRTWEFPVPADEPSELGVLRGRLDAARVRAIFDYAYRRRATVSQVLLAAFYLAVHHARPQPSGGPFGVVTFVDLRRYLPAKRASALCNVIGMALITIDSRSGESLDGVVTQVRDQIQSQRREHLGLPLSSFVVDTLPVVRHLAGLIPYRWYKRWALRRNQREGRSRGGRVEGAVMFTDFGQLEADRLAFAGADITDACVTGGGGGNDPGVLAMGMSGFQGSVTVTLGFGRALVGGLFEHMTRILPA